MATNFMSMAAKMSDRGDNMSEANLQADGLVGKASPRNSKPAGDGRRGQLPP